MKLIPKIMMSINYQLVHVEPVASSSPFSRFGPSKWPEGPSSHSFGPVNQPAQFPFAFFLILFSSTDFKIPIYLIRTCYMIFLIFINERKTTEGQS